MFLVDNIPAYGTGMAVLDGANCPYKLISAQELEHCQRAPMSYRAELVTSILQTIRSEVEQLPPKTHAPGGGVDSEDGGLF